MGISLKEIKTLLSLPGNNAAVILEDHLIQLSKKIRSLREQQYSVVNILKNKDILKKAGMIDKELWVKILQSSGLDSGDMKRWHMEFEKISPQAHHEFLAALGISEYEIKEIREGEN